MIVKPPLPTGATGAAAQPLIDAPRGLFAQHMDQREFAFAHRLAGNPTLEPRNLIDIARQMARDGQNVTYARGPNVSDAVDAGVNVAAVDAEIKVVAVDADVNVAADDADVHVVAVDADVHVAAAAAAYRRAKPLLHARSTDDVMREVANGDATVILRDLQTHPIFSALLAACFAEVDQRAGHAYSRFVDVRNGFVRIASPHAVTPYTVERDCRLVLQIHGSQTVTVFDRTDPQVLPQTELEQIWTTGPAAAVYKPELDERARTFELLPGRAIHLPLNAPHSSRNGADITVSLHLHFALKEHLLADVYRMNYWLRRIGWRPLPPRRSAVVDCLKGLGYAFARGLSAARESASSERAV